MFRPGTGAPMELPDVNIGVAWAAVAALKAATTVARSVAHQLAEGEAEQAEWSGLAADEYRNTKAALVKEVDQLAMTCGAVATAISGWADLVAPAVTQLREIIAEAKTAEGQQRAQQAVGNYTDLAVEARVNDAWTQYDRVGRRYLETCRETGDRLNRIRDQVPERPWDARDNAGGFVSTAWNSAVAEPAEFAWGLSGEAFVDRTRWWANVKGYAWGLGVQNLNFAMDPVGASRDFIGEQLHLEAWRQEHFGEGAAALGTLWIAREPRLRAPLSEKLVYFRRNLADPLEKEPPKVQPAEMLEEVDLGRSEHFRLGHSERRHIIVNHFYLQDRIVHGTLLDNGSRGPRPPLVSAWNDLDTANLWVGEALRRREPEFLAWAASNTKAPFPVVVSSPKPLGEVMRRSGNGFLIDDAHHAFGLIEKTDGGVYVSTSYLGRNPFVIHK